MIRKIEDDEEKITSIKEIVEIDGEVEISRQGDFLVIKPTILKKVGYKK